MSKTNSRTDTKVTTTTLSKGLVDIIHQTWHPRDECYEAILQICKDYEAGVLFYNRAWKRKWKALVDKKVTLDVNVDGRKNRPILLKNWLRPFTRVPNAYYLSLARLGAAKPIPASSLRPAQSYFFDCIQDWNADSQTLAGAVEWIRRREAMKNMTCWLMVANHEHSSNSMKEFFSHICHEVFSGRH